MNSVSCASRGDISTLRIWVTFQLGVYRVNRKLDFVLNRHSLPLLSFAKADPEPLHPRKLADTVFRSYSAGLRFELLAVLANNNVQAAFNNYLKEARDKKSYPGLEQLPKEAVEYDRITVTRR